MVNIPFGWESIEGAGWVPPVDIYETGDAYVLNAELPGVSREDIRIEVTGSELCIRGERHFDTVCSEESYYCLEGQRGTFCRKFTLPEEVDGGAITANLRDGVLQVKLPKSSAKTGHHTPGSAGRSLNNG
jgi:HSP20 family protein